MPTPALTPLRVLLTFVEHLPMYARRLIVLGEPMAKTLDRCAWIDRYVETLLECGWTLPEIQSFFSSGLSFGSIEVFQREYGKEPETIQRVVQDACPEERRPLSAPFARHSGLPTTATPALHRLATFAQGLYEGTQTGCFLAALPIGSGKTTQFLVPFVTHCMKQDTSRGLIVAMERIKDVKKYAAEVNKQFEDTIAYALYSHDPDPNVCPENCRKKHKERRAQADNYPLLFCTHAMLSRAELHQYQQWAGGNRVMALIDEKPSSWWVKGSIDKHDLELFQAHICHMTGDTKTSVLGALQEARAKLQTTKHGEEIQLQVKLTEGQVHAVSRWLQASERVSKKEKDNLTHTVENLFALGRSGGALAKGTHKKGKGNGQILVFRQRLLPQLPTIILDGTGDYDPEYHKDIDRLVIDPWEEMTPPAKHVRLVTWSVNLTKDYTLKPRQWERLREGIRDSAGAVLGQSVYVVCAKDNEESIRTRLQADADLWGALLEHFGNTKGRNDLRHTAAIAFTSVQFKRDSYYQNIALATGKGVILANASVRAKKRREYRDRALQDIKIRDTVGTLVQEIGRTRLRENGATEVAALLPWGDEKGVAAFIHQVASQFQATVEHEQRVISVGNPRTQLEQLLALVQPGDPPRNRDDIAQQMTMRMQTKDKRAALRKWLSKPETKRELWSREIKVTRDAISVPLRTQTQARIETVKRYIASTQASPQARAA